jgi:hypothetical protein
VSNKGEKNCFSYDPDKITKTGSLYCFILVDMPVILRKEKEMKARRQEIDIKKNLRGFGPLANYADRATEEIDIYIN